MFHSFTNKFFWGAKLIWFLWLHQLKANCQCLVKDVIWNKNIFITSWWWCSDFMWLHLGANYAPNQPKFSAQHLEALICYFCNWTYFSLLLGPKFMEDLTWCFWKTCSEIFCVHISTSVSVKFKFTWFFFHGLKTAKVGWAVS